jgi:predicted nucleic acid-binding protein
MTGIVIDTNIIFSALIGKSKTIANIIILSGDMQFYTCDYMRTELKKHRDKLKKASKLSDEEIDTAQYELFKYIRFITLETIPEKYWQAAELLVSDIDIDDIAFVALSLYCNACLWTGDKILYNGLKRKGFENVISTDELKFLQIK